MTKKHFEAFAKEIKNQEWFTAGGVPTQVPSSVREAQIALVERVAVKFNPSFNPTTFRKACGL